MECAWEEAVVSAIATFWRKEIQKKIGDYNEKYLRCADYDFFIRMGLSGAKFYYTRDFLAVYRLNTQQLTRSIELCRSEASKISQNYMDKNISTTKLKWKKIKLKSKRLLNIIAQGDFWYVFRYVLRGLLRHTGVLKNP